MASSAGLVRFAAIAAWLVSVFAYVISVGLVVANRTSDDVVSELVAVAIRNFSFVAVATLAFLILRRQPRNVVAWAMMLAGVVFPLEAFFAEFTEYALARWGEVGITLFAGWVSRWIWLGATLAAPLILLYYPDGKLPSVRWRPVLVGIRLIVLVAWFVSAFDPTPMTGFGDLANPVGIEALASGPAWVSAMSGLAFWGLFILPLVGAVSLIPRFRRSTGVQRQQMKLIAWVGAVAVFYFLVLDGFFDLAPVTDAITDTIFTLFVGAAITVGIVRYKVFEMDRIISRSISYTIVVVVLGGVFVFGVVGVPNALGLQDSPLLVAASTLAVAGLFNPLRKRIQNAVDRRFNRSRYEADQVTEIFATRLQQSLSSEQLGREWIETVNTYFEPSSSGIWLNEDPTTPRT